MEIRLLNLEQCNGQISKRKIKWADFFFFFAYSEIFFPSVTKL